jgi:hypothetical protein
MAAASSGAAPGTEGQLLGASQFSDWRLLSFGLTTVSRERGASVAVSARNASRSLSAAKSLSMCVGLT